MKLTWLWRYAIFAIFLFTGCHRALPSQQELKQISYDPQNRTSGSGGRCFLCWRGPQENDRLAFLSINESSMSFVELSKQKEDEVQETSGYTTISWDDPKALGCTIQSQTYPKSGLFTGEIRPGDAPDPIKDKLKQQYCSSCRKSLKQVLNGYDMVLVDVEGHTLYNICNGDYRFDIRNYSIRTQHKPDGNIAIDIFNHEAGEDKKPDWV